MKKQCIKFLKCIKIFIGDDIMEKDGNKIKCNVVKCVHNCIDDSTCRLNTIKVCECMNDKKSSKREDQTACDSYEYVGNLNKSEILGGN